jgi:hypothetical protein
MSASVQPSRHFLLDGPLLPRAARHREVRIGFGRVELLAVVSIIAILGGWLASAVHKVRVSASRTSDL